MTIGGFARRLSKKLPEGSTYQSYAEIIVKETLRLEQMVREMVETMVISISTEKEHDLNEVVRGALGIIRTSIEGKQVSLKLEMVKDLPPLVMDVGNMKRVILQLVANALEAMAPGGALRLRTWSGEDFVELQVADDGKGIPAAILPHIFETFFSTKPAGPGLGLAIVHKIITHHHGQISIESQENVGTTVTIRLPSAKPALTP